MTVVINTEYLGQGRYKITVRQEIKATCGTVEQVRNRACEMWAAVADQVVTNEIPEAWDMRKKGPAE